MELLEALDAFEAVNGPTFTSDPDCECPTCKAGRDVEAAKDAARTS